MLSQDDLIFERATPMDAAVLLELERCAAVSVIYEARTKLKEAINEIAENDLYLIAYQGAVIGSASFRILSNGNAYIGNVAVDPAFRRMGVARAIMKFLLARAADAPSIELVTHPDNDGALRLYTSLGFSIGETVANYFGDGQPRVKMSRSGAQRKYPCLT
jgi:ribosomal protein S18 acetylase RimI-like enzyme